MLVKRMQPTPGLDKDFFGCSRGRGCEVFISPYCVPSCEKSKPQGQAFSLWEDNYGCLEVCECVCVCVHMDVCMCPCIHVPMYTCAHVCAFPCQDKSEDKSGTFKKMLILCPLTQPQT
jgi:hypothetical protein